MASSKKDQKDIINSPIFQVKYNGKPIPRESVKRLRLDYSLTSLGPQGLLELVDSDGFWTKSFKFPVGGCFSIAIYESGEDPSNPREHTFIFDDFYIKRSWKTFPFEESSARMMCVINIQLESRWAFQQDTQAHAYPAELLSKTIKRVVQDSNRGFTIPCNFNDDLETTSDLGNKPNYKYGLGDKDFIEQVLLPKCSVQSKYPLYAYLNEGGWFHLKSFKNLLNQSPKAALIAGLDLFSEEAITRSGNYEEIRPFELIEVTGTEDLAKRLNKRFYVTSEADNTTKLIEDGIVSESPDDSEHYLPVEKNFKEFMSYFNTSVQYIRNVAYDDFFGYSRFLSRDEDRIITVIGQSDFAVNSTLGKVIRLITPSGDKAESLLNTNYVVGEISYVAEGLNNTVKTIVSLWTPNISKTPVNKDLLTNTECARR